MPRKPYEADPHAVGQKPDSLSKLDDKTMKSLGGKKTITPPYISPKSPSED